MNKKELNEIIKEDKEIYFGKFSFKNIFKRLTKYPYCEIGKYVILCRKAGYYTNNRKGLWNWVLCVYYTRKKNKMGQKVNIEFGPNEFGRRLRIYHGNVVVNGYCHIGDDCSLYGSNCIGNKGVGYDLKDVPQIGNNVSIGVGTKVIGNIKINDGISISSVSLVNKNLEESNSLYAGIPVRFIKKL